MLRFLPYIVISVVVYAMLIYMQTYQRDELNMLIVKYDRFHWTQIAKDEFVREQKIDNITDSIAGATQKDILKQRKVFLGATAEMVEDALTEHPDDPNDGPIFSYPAVRPGRDAAGNPTQTYYLAYGYFIGDDKRPTVFIFQCAQSIAECADYKHHKNIFILIKAYKRPTIDLGNPQDLFTN